MGAQNHNLSQGNRAAPFPLQPPGERLAKNFCASCLTPFPAEKTDFAGYG